MPIDASGKDEVLDGRIRQDLSDPSGHSVSIFVAADQPLKGAALNAIQIAELLPQTGVPDTAQRTSRGAAEPGPPAIGPFHKNIENNPMQSKITSWPRISSAPRRKAGVVRRVRGTIWVRRF
jgi:hypothetical protein